MHRNVYVKPNSRMRGQSAIRVLSIAACLSRAPGDIAPQPTAALSTLADDKFKDFLKLLPSSAPVLSDRTALITAAGDRVTKAIFTVLGDPTIAQQFKDKTVLFGVSMVSVNPGWRTSKGYGRILEC